MLIHPLISEQKETSNYNNNFIHYIPWGELISLLELVSIVVFFSFLEK